MARIDARRALPVVVALVAGAALVSQAWAGTPVTGQSLTRLLVFALPVAGVYAISATGLVVVHSATGIFNISQGAIGMVCAFAYWELTVERGLPALAGLLLVAGVLAPLLGVALDAVLMRRLAAAPLMIQLVGTVGLTTALLGVTTTVWNPNDSYPIDGLGGDGGVRIAGVLLGWHRVITIVVAVALALALRQLLFRTRLGVSMRAVVDDPELAALHGVRPRRVSAVAWALGCACAALAGILIAPEVGNMSAETLSLLIINAFAAAVVGRLRSLPLTYLGALGVGVLVSFSTTFLDLGGRWSPVSGALPVLALFVVLLAMRQPQLRLGRVVRSYRMERVPSVRSAVTAAGVLVGLALLAGPLLSDVNVGRLTAGLTTGIVLLGLVPLLGWAGIPFFAPYALAGFGAWFTWRLSDPLGEVGALAVAGLGTAAVGVLAALPALRLRDLYLALGSIAFALVATSVVFAQPELFAEPKQLGRPVLFGVDLRSPTAFLTFVAVTYALLALAVVALRRSRYGRRLVALRDSEAAAACVGISLVETKVVVFAVAGAVSGVGGGVLALGQRFVSVEQFPMIGGLAIILSLTVWGVGTVSGPLVAGLTATILVAVSQDFATGDWAHALELAGPGLAALALVGLPRGQIVEVTERARHAPGALVARLAGMAAGAALGIGLSLPGFVGFLLVIVGALVANTLVGLARPATLAEGADVLDEPGLGLSAPLTAGHARRLDAALGVSGRMPSAVLAAAGAGGGAGVGAGAGPAAGERP